MRIVICLALMQICVSHGRYVVAEQPVLKTTKNDAIETDGGVGKDNTAVPRWILSDGKQIEGTPVTSSYNKETKQMEFTFQQTDGTKVRIPFEAFDGKTKEAIGEAIRAMRAEQQNRITKLRQDMELRQQEQKKLQREKEEAEFDASQFTLTSGDVATGSQLKEHNEKINGEISRFVLELDQSDLVRYHAAMKNFVPIQQALEAGNRKALISWMDKLVSAAPSVRQDIAWLVEKTPARGGLVAVSDGRALYFREAWSESCDIYADAVRAGAK